MNLSKVILLVTVLFSYLITDPGDCLLFKKDNIPVAATSSLLPKPTFLNILLMKLFFIRKSVFLINTVAIGSMLMGQGSELLVGTIGGVTVAAKLGKLYLLTRLYQHYKYKYKSKSKKPPARRQTVMVSGKLRSKLQFKLRPFQPDDLREFPHLRWPGFKTSSDWADPVNTPYRGKPKWRSPLWKYITSVRNLKVFAGVGPFKTKIPARNPKYMKPPATVYNVVAVPHNYHNELDIEPFIQDLPYTEAEIYSFLSGNPTFNSNTDSKPAPVHKNVAKIPKYNKLTSIPKLPPVDSSIAKFDRLREFEETENILRNVLNQLGEADEATIQERYKLILRLREAFKLKLLLERFSIPSVNEVPEFLPFPETKPPVVSKKSKRRKRSQNENDLDFDAEEFIKEQRFVETLTRETNEFFTLISAFDQDTCLQKLVCEVHARAGNANETVYDRNIVSMFKIAHMLLEDEDKTSSLKYTDAASFGADNNKDSVTCKRQYNSCQYSYEQIIDMGKKVDQGFVDKSKAKAK